MRKLILMGLVFTSLVSRAEGCFIDGANVPRCPPQKPGHYQGVSWPVFTAETPAEVWAESQRNYAAINSIAYDSPRLDLRDKSLVVKHVRFETDPPASTYPDVMCFDFYFKGTKHSQVCFDTMEITER